MRTHSLLMSLSLLTSCANVPARSIESTTEPLPGLAYPRLKTGKRMPAPAAISRLLLSLPTQNVLASPALRQRYLQGKVLLQEVPGQGGSPDYLLVDQNGSWYGFWVRSFRGTRPELTGYLVQVRGLCADLRATTPIGTPLAAAAERQCSTAGPPWEFDSGMRAYRVVEGQPPEDVTASIAPDPAVSSKAQREQYESMGANEIAADIDNLDQLPVFRWVVEADPEQPFPVSDPHSFHYGHMAHAGFVVWDGERFENRKTVPRALWPCEKWLDEDGSALPCPDATPEGDRFISDDKSIPAMD